MIDFKDVVKAVELSSTIRDGAVNFAEIADVGRSIYKLSLYIPRFAKSLQLNSVSTFEEADKPIYISEEKSFNSNGNELSEKNGGSYKDVFKEGEGDKIEVHHMPADSVNGLDRNDGPAIKMDKEDHRMTASCGNSAEANEYRQLQKELIDNGKFRDALQMDIDDIKDKFGNKYDNAIAEMLEYVNQLEKEGKI